MLYVIQRGQDGPVKIGLTAHPQARLAQLQTAHDVDLYLRAVWEGDRADELALHDRFAPSRLRGEWFSLDPDVEEFVNEKREGYESVRERTRPRFRHHLWDNHHAGLADDERRDSDEWIGVLCEIAPSLSAEQVLVYLGLVERADAEGCAVDVDLDALSDAAFAVRDRRRVARAIVDLSRLLLPAPTGPYYGSNHSGLVMTLSVPSPAPAASGGWQSASAGTGPAFVEAMACHGTASVRLVRYGAGFGVEALPQSFPRDKPLSARIAWATEVVVAGRDHDDHAGRWGSQN